MTRTENEQCLQMHLAAEHRHDMEATLATVHPDCVFVDQQLGQQFVGLEGARRHYELWWSGLGAVVDDGQLHWISDDVVIGDSTFVGHHAGDFAGIAPTGRSIRLPFVVFVEFRDGLLVGERFVYDLNMLLRQLGYGGFTPQEREFVSRDSDGVFNAWPPGFQAMRALDAAINDGGLDRRLLELVKVRASQINGCAFCLDMHTKDWVAGSEDPMRLVQLDAWRDSPGYSAAERAALALTESVTRCADGVPESVTDDAKQHFEPVTYFQLLYAIATINAWNRLAIAGRAPAGRYRPRTAASSAHQT